MFREPLVAVPSTASSVRPQKYWRAVRAVGITNPNSATSTPLPARSARIHGVPAPVPRPPNASSSISASTSSVAPATHPPRAVEPGAPAVAEIAAAVTAVPDCVTVTYGESARTSHVKSSNRVIASCGSTHDAPIILRRLSLNWMFLLSLTLPICLVLSPVPGPHPGYPGRGGPEAHPPRTRVVTQHS